MASDPSNFRIETVGEDDLQTYVYIINRAFSGFSIEQELGNTGDSEGKKATAQRHYRAWQEHREDTGLLPAVQCIHTDPDTGKETTVACAEWFLYPKPLPRNDERGASYLISGIWLPVEAKAKLQQAFKAPLDLRAKWTAGTGFGLLMYMATDPDWRRQGAATLCVNWGIERCHELGIPAYLEASKEGAPVYEKLGFEIVDDVRMEYEGEKMEYPAMMWRPSGTAYPCAVADSY